MKIFLNVRGYRYLEYGIDSPRSLALIEETVGSGKLPGDISPRIFLPLIGSWEELVFGVKPEYQLLPLLVLGIISSVIVVYNLSLLVWQKKSVAVWAVLFYSLSLTVIQTSSSVLFSLLFGPVLLLMSVRYIYNRTRLTPVIICFAGGFLFYSAFLFLIYDVLLGFLLLKVFTLGIKRDIAGIKHIAPLFPLLPLTVLFYYSIDTRIAILSYQPVLIYIWRVFGLWLSKNLYPGSAYLIIICLVSLLLIAGVLQFFPKTVSRICRYLSPRISVFRAAPKSVISYPVALAIAAFSLSLLWDLVTHLHSFPASFKETILNPQLLVSYQFFSNIIGGELWREIFLPLAIIFALAAISVFLSKSKSEILWLLIIFPVISLVSSFLRPISLFAVLADSRGFVLISPFLAVLAAGVTKSKFWNQPTAVFVCFLLFVFSFGVNLYPHEPINPLLPHAWAKYRSARLSSDVLIISPSSLLPDENTEKYYTMSFLPFRRPFADQAFINLLLDRTCPQPAVLANLLRAEGYKYVFIEPGVLPELTAKFRQSVSTRELYTLNAPGLYNYVTVLQII